MASWNLYVKTSKRQRSHQSWLLGTSPSWARQPNGSPNELQTDPDHAAACPLAVCKRASAELCRWKNPRHCCSKYYRGGQTVPTSSCSSAVHWCWCCPRQRCCSSVPAIPFSSGAVSQSWLSSCWWPLELALWGCLLCYSYVHEPLASCRAPTRGLPREGLQVETGPFRTWRLAALVDVATRHR